MSDRKDSWQEREELVNKDLRYAIEIKKITLEQEKLSLEQKRKPSKYDENMKRHMEYEEKHLDFMQRDADRKKKVDAVIQASCEDQRKQLARIADSLEKITTLLKDSG